jgi:hypothetical protein
MCGFRRRMSAPAKADHVCDRLPHRPGRALSAKHNQGSERYCVKDAMQGIRLYAVAFRQESVRRTEHRPVARRKTRLSVQQVRNPPGLYLARKQQRIADPQPPPQPPWTSLVKVDGAGRESNRKGGGADQRCSNQFGPCVRRANRLHVIEPSQRNPIVQGKEQNMEGLKCNQCARNDGTHVVPEFTGSLGFSAPG